MSEVRIITNNVPRDIIYGYELSAEERAEFDYIDWQQVESGEGDLGEFVRYKGELYDLNDTEGECPWAPGWVYCSDSFFSGVLFRYPIIEYGYGRRELDTEHVICGRYLA